MKIAIEAQRLFRPKKHGMEVVALEMLREIKKISSKHELFLFVKQDKDTCIISNENLKVVELPSSPYPIWEQLILRKEVKKYDIDLLHCTANTAPLNFKDSYVVTLHDIIYLEGISFKGNSYQNFGNLYRRFVVPKIAEDSKCVVTVSNYERERIIDRLRLAQDKVKVVYNAVNPSFRLIDKQDLVSVKIKYGLPDNFILHFANTAPKKNTFGAIKAFAEIKSNAGNSDLYLVVTDSNEEFIKKILKSINAEDLISSIKILDYVSFDEIPYIYNLAKVFLYPSIRESFGMPILEAMACGVPVVTSNTSSMPEIADNAAALANPYSFEDIANCIEIFLKQQGVRKKYVANGLAHSQKFNWKNTAENILTIYDEALM